MSLSYLTQFPLESITLNIIPVFCVVLCMAELVSILLIHRVSRVHEPVSKTKSFEDSKAHEVEEKNQDSELPCSIENKEDDGDICRGDVEVVMEKLGIVPHSEDGKMQERLDSDELSKLFEEKEPSLDEVKGAFEVFDENQDGFIDTKELQRILCGLGFKEGGEVENCRRMIGMFDENGDGRIDFGEFVRIMENIG